MFFCRFLARTSRVGFDHERHRLRRFKGVAPQSCCARLRHLVVAITPGRQKVGAYLLSATVTNYYHLLGRRFPPVRLPFFTNKEIKLKGTEGYRSGLPKKICKAKIFWEEEQPTEKSCRLTFGNRLTKSRVATRFRRPTLCDRAKRGNTADGLLASNSQFQLSQNSPRVL